MKPHLGVVVLYYSTKFSKIITRFLSIIELEEVNSDGIFSKLEEVLLDFGLDYKSMIGYGSDGAAVVSGCNNSVWTRLLTKNSNLIRFTCVCHSLAKIAEEAFSELPSRMSAILKMVPKWFKKSDKRKKEYTALFESMESLTQTSKPFEKYAETRWLSRGKVIKTLLNNWDVLIAYFEKIMPSLKRELKFNASVILESLYDLEQKKLFIFCLPIVENLETKNLLFQSDFTDPLTVVEEINFMKNSFYRRIFDTTGNLLPIERIDFGTKFEESKPSLSTKSRALNFIKTAFEELSKRSSNSLETVKRIEFLKPSIVLNTSNRPLFSSFPVNEMKTDQAEEEYRQLVDYRWQEFCETPINQISTTQFWINVEKHDRFKNLGKYMLSLMILPLSNASTERIFSLCGAIKTKSRNRLIISTLDSLVTVRSYVSETKKCCYDLNITNSMLENFNLSIYK